MQSTELELALIKNHIETGNCPVKGVPIDIAYKPGLGWTLVTNTQDIVDLNGEQRMRFARWLIELTEKLNREGIQTRLERG